jgi:hypothetical protein
MPSFQNDPVVSVSESTQTPAISGEGKGHAGVHGLSHNAQAGVIGSNTGGGFGVYGQSDDGQGVVGESNKLAGVFGRGPTGGRFESGSGPAVDAVALGDSGEGVQAVSHSASSGVLGINDFSPADAPGEGGNGGWFHSAHGEGVRGVADNPHHGGVVGVNTAGGFGVYGQSDDGQGVVGESNKFTGVFGRGPTGGRFEGGSGPAVHAVALGRGAAGHFDGNVVVTGDIQLAGADLAEQFEVVGELAAEPGSVVVLAGYDRVRVSDEPYDRRVAGVVSGAAGYQPAVVLDRRAGAGRRPLALTGKVWCKIDADYAPVELGDLLTTSPTPGHAMNAGDPRRAFGAVIGKALRSLPSGRSLVPILVALQ